MINCNISFFFDTIFGIRGGIWVAGYGFAREQRCQNVVVAVEVEVGDTVVFMTRSVAILELLSLCLKAPKTYFSLQGNPRASVPAPSRAHTP